ncbi:hypothetical protein OZX72_03025 [Bifidobacterium sp. ESL0769]|uniref:hypothetical protein n=1 Tax=Bifidobacterium sp. ESL0769 TaxID=2983229 RepID=UPI0023F70C80|nr:hypothetical protein [Bifidobacterium sp. ESL0769]WEV67970.1 hypothetical protein OZX72_03025 [Bifidobacterium sp. ESL0769]
MFRITYTDGHTDDCEPTLFDSIQAEKYCMANGYQDSPIASGAYATYATLRRNGKTEAGQTFETWAQHVESINVNAEADTPASPASTATPDPGPQPMSPEPVAVPLQSGLPAAYPNAV